MLTFVLIRKSSFIWPHVYYVSVVLDVFSMSVLMSAYSSVVILSDRDYFILRNTKKIRYAALGIPNA